MELRPYQEKLIEDIRREWARGNRWVVACMNMGLGKTATASYMVHKAVQNGKRVLWLAHRVELIDQAAKTLHRVGIPKTSIGLIQAGTRGANPYREVQVASIQTLLSRSDNWDKYDLIINDEVHHQVSDKWAELPAHYKPQGTFCVGLSATPCRQDGRGLGEYFDAMVYGPKPSEAIELGVLVPCEVNGPPEPLSPGEIALSPVVAYQKYAPGRKAVVFAAHRLAGKNFTDEFKKAGIRAEFVSGDLSMSQRAKILHDYKHRALDVIVNVGILTEGWDDPPTDCVILARSVGSLGLYLQIVGRGLRSAPGKENCVLIDLHGASCIFGPPDEDRQYTLDGDGRGGKSTRVKERFCKVCGVLIVGSDDICECTLARGESEMPDIVNIELVKYAKKRAEGEDKRVATLKKWIGIAEEKDYKITWAYVRYKAVYGHYPPASIVKAAQ